MALPRLAQIVAVAVKHGLDEALLRRASELKLAWLLPSYWRQRPTARFGERLALAFDELGPVFVKLGQFLSVRPDMIPEEMTKDLSKLRDQVSPISEKDVQEVLETAYRAPVDTVFAAFDPHPVASASIAQVHRAQLETGESVAVKVVRPHISNVIARDIRLLRRLAQLAERWAGVARRLRAVELVDLYETIICNELDMVREGASAAQLRNNFRESPLLDIPRVHWEYTRENVLVLDYVEGIALDRIDELIEADIDLAALAERGVEIFFTQVFEHNFFHADMHPGNIFAGLGNGTSAPRYLAVDFGIMGSLSREDQRYLAENFLAFFNRDYRRVAELHVASGWVPDDTRVDSFEAAIRTVCEPIFERPLGQIEFGQLLVRLFQTARRYDMQVQPDLILLQKTLLHIEGLGRQLHPELDLWHTAKPFFERWIARRSSPEAVARAIGASLPRWAALIAELGPELPEFIARTRIAQRANSSGPVVVPHTSGKWSSPLLCAVVGLAAVGFSETNGQIGTVGLILLGVGLGLVLGSRRFR